MQSEKYLFPTTVIGSFPKPEYVSVPKWFDEKLREERGQASYTTDMFDKWRATLRDDEFEAMIEKGVKEVVELQTELGVDQMTDGELSRENYVHHHCRHLNGIDFENLTSTVLRCGNYSQDMPTIRTKISAREPFLIDAWKMAQSFTDKIVKVTLPGPMTITDTCAVDSPDLYNDNRELLLMDLAEALNVEILRLVEAGVKVVQVDEPLWARKP